MALAPELPNRQCYPGKLVKSQKGGKPAPEEACGEFVVFVGLGAEESRGPAPTFRLVAAPELLAARSASSYDRPKKGFGFSAFYFLFFFYFLLF